MRLSSHIFYTQLLILIFPQILKYVESRMKYYAPNVTAIVGSTIAAQLISIAGGLKRLADMPATNVQVLGNKKANLAGFSSAFAATRAGFIYHTETVQVSYLCNRHNC